MLPRKLPLASAGRRGLAVLAVGSLASSLFGGCEQKIPSPPPAERSEVRGSLPPPPDFTQKAFERMFPDGTLTVAGLVREREKLIGETVSVRGRVTKLVKCPPPPPPPPPDTDIVEDKKGGKDAGAAEPPPPPPRPPRLCDAPNPQPNFFLVDLVAPGREVQVVGTMWSLLPKFAEGQDVTVTGTFDIVSPDGTFIRQAGLVILDDVPEVVPTGIDEGAETPPDAQP